MNIVKLKPNQPKPDGYSLVLAWSIDYRDYTFAEYGESGWKSVDPAVDADAWFYAIPFPTEVPFDG